MLGERTPLAKCLSVAIVALVAASAGARDPGTGQSIPEHEAQQWARWVIPLPREIRWDRKVAVPASQVAITVSPEAGLLGQRGAEELAAALARETGVRVPVGKGPQPKAALEIVLGTCTNDGRWAGRPVPGAQRLGTLPCAEQAYRIVP